MIGVSAAYIAGLFFASFFTGIREILLLVAAVAAVIFIGSKIAFSRSDYLMLTLCFIAACTVMGYNSRSIYAGIKAFDGIRGSFSGKITDIKHYSAGKSSYIIKGSINGRVCARITYYGNDLEAQYGDIINIDECSFSSLQGDYLFDTESYYRSQRVFLQAGSVKGLTVEHTDSAKIKNLLASYRERMTSQFRSRLGKDRGDFLSGMIFGEKQGLDYNIKTALYRVGIGHVLSVSGLHVSIIAVVLMQILNAIGINRYVSFGVLNVLMILLILMANSPVSAIRAAIMMDFFCCARLFRRQNDTLNSLAAAALLICLANPYSIYSSGFLLSLSGTFGIGVFGPYMVRNIPDRGLIYRFLRSITVMVCTSLSLLPLSMMYFDETSLISPLSNILILPLCSLAMLIGIIHVLTGGFVSFIDISGIIIKFVMYISEKLSKLRFTYFSCSGKDMVMIAFGGAALTLLVYMLLRNRAAVSVACTSVCAVLLIYSGACSRIRYGNCIAAVVGKGSGAAVIVSYNGCTDIIDLSGDYRAAAYVRKYLMENGISDVENAVLTNNVNSQYSAYLSELEYVDVDEWVLCSDTGITGADRIYNISGSGFIIDHIDYTVEYEDNCVMIRFGDQCAAFVPVNNSDLPENCPVVCYGSIPSGYDISDETCFIYTDTRYEKGINNFEIILSGDGEYKLRRL